VDSTDSEPARCLLPPSQAKYMVLTMQHSRRRCNFRYCQHLLRRRGYHPRLLLLSRLLLPPAPALLLGFGLLLPPLLLPPLLFLRAFILLPLWSRLRECAPDSRREELRLRRFSCLEPLPESRALDFSLFSGRPLSCFSCFPILSFSFSLALSFSLPLSFSFARLSLPVLTLLSFKRSLSRSFSLSRSRCRSFSGILSDVPTVATACVDCCSANLGRNTQRYGNGRSASTGGGAGPSPGVTHNCTQPLPPED